MSKQVLEVTPVTQSANRIAQHIPIAFWERSFGNLS